MDQPQPVFRVLSVPVHAVMTQILSTFQCRALSSPHYLESGVLSDSSMDCPCGDGGPMLQSQQTGLVLAPRRGPCPQDSPACRRQKTTQPRWQGLMVEAGQAEGPLICVWMRREMGSPESPSEMSLSLPGPGANLSLRGHAPSPEAQIISDPER